MPRFRPFAMERWQSTWENRVDFNLSESGVHPLTLGELLALAGDDARATAPRIDELVLGYGQSNGTDELRAAIAALYPGAHPDGVVVTNGSAEANFVALWDRVEPGDEVAILAPTYMQGWGVAEAFGATVRPIELHEAAGWQPDPDEVARVIGDRTRMVIVTNPGNPTGAVLGEEALRAVTGAADRHGAWILADEVYAGAERSGVVTPSLLGRAERVIVTGSLSKAYGLPGLRIGWALTDPAAAERLWAHTDYTTIAPATVSDALARFALSETVRPRLIERTRTRIAAGLAVLEEWLHEMGGFTWQPPAAGAICYARYDAPIDSATLAERLRVEQSVLIVPGAHFGMGSYIRFGFGIEVDALRTALDRCATLLHGVAIAGAR